MKTESVKNKIVCSNLYSNHTSATPKITKKNIAPSEVTDNVEDERGDAFRGIPKRSCLGLP